MRPPSSDSDTGLFGALFARGPVAEQVGTRAWLLALLHTESALALAAGRAGLVAIDDALVVAEHCADPDTLDAAAIAADVATTGTPVLPLVEALRARLPEPVRGALHVGATSQDVMDTAMMLVATRALAALDPDLGGAADACAGLARAHRDTVMAGRTLLQQAVPITFGLTAAGWMAALDGARVRLDATRRSLPVQYGGAAGTQDAAQGRGQAVAALMAEICGLQVPVLPWHTARLPVADLAAALGTTAGVVGKVATDLVLLAQTEVGEVTDAVPGRGGSSAMAHKANPVAAVAARACALRAPGLVATLLASMQAEHERGAGGWHAEWPTLSTLMQVTGSAVAWLRDALENASVHADRMGANLSADLAGAGVGAAGELVDAALAARPGRPGDGAT